jgi:plasmid stabilization system protein ParE
MAEILDYIEARSPQGAETVKRRLQAVIGLLADHPDAGRVTNKGDLRRVVAVCLPAAAVVGNSVHAGAFCVASRRRVAAIPVFGRRNRHGDREAVSRFLCDSWPSSIKTRNAPPGSADDAPRRTMVVS